MGDAGLAVISTAERGLVDGPVILGERGADDAGYLFHGRE
jgi:hypothetical protein